MRLILTFSVFNTPPLSLCHVTFSIKCASFIYYMRDVPHFSNLRALYVVREMSRTEEIFFQRKNILQDVYLEV